MEIIFFILIALFLIPFLHQITTLGGGVCERGQLFLIPFLHQITTSIAFLIIIQVFTTNNSQIKRPIMSKKWFDVLFFLLQMYAISKTVPTAKGSH